MVGKKAEPSKDGKTAVEKEAAKVDDLKDKPAAPNAKRSSTKK